MKTTLEIISAYGPCKEAREWAKSHKSFYAAWRSCERGDWMLWFVSRAVGIGRCPLRYAPAQRGLWLARADCAALVLPIFEKIYPRDSGPRDAIKAIVDYAAGRIDKDRLVKAAAAARAAASASAASSADAAYAAASAAAYAASAAAAAAYAAAADTYAAAADTLAKCATIVRCRISCRQIAAAIKGCAE